MLKVIFFLGMLYCFVSQPVCAVKYRFLGADQQDLTDTELKPIAVAIAQNQELAPPEGWEVEDVKYSWAVVGGKSGNRVQYMGQDYIEPVLLGASLSDMKLEKLPANKIKCAIEFHDIEDLGAIHHIYKKEMILKKKS